MKGSKSKGLIACIVVCAMAASCLWACASQKDAGGGSGVPAGSSAENATVAWSFDDDCGACHAAQAGSMEDSGCLASLHAEAGNTCQTCHSDQEGLAAVHEEASADGAKKLTKLRKTSIDQDACLACHGGYEELAAKTADSTFLTDAEGTVVNPHALPPKEDHANITCADCHAMHTDASSSELAPEFCISCHHANVYACHTCHD